VNFEPDRPALQNVYTIFKKYGPSARVCFTLAAEMRRCGKYDGEVRKAINKDLSDIVDAVISYSLGDTSTCTSSHKVFLMLRDENFDGYTDVASNYILDILTKVHMQRDRQEVRKLYEHFMAYSYTRSSAGKIFEMICHHRLCPDDHSVFWPSLQLRSLNTPDTEMSLEIGPLKMKDDFSLSMKIKLQAVPGVYYLPRASNNRTFDSFIVGPDNSVVLFQMTVSDDHSILFSGLDMLSKVLPARFLPWNSGVKWKFVFVVPNDDIATKYIVRKFKGSEKDDEPLEKKAKMAEHLQDHVTQWVTCLKAFDTPSLLQAVQDAGPST